MGSFIWLKAERTYKSEFLTSLNTKRKIKYSTYGA